MHYILKMADGTRDAGRAVVAAEIKAEADANAKAAIKSFEARLTNAINAALDKIIDGPHDRVTLSEIMK